MAAGRRDPTSRYGRFVAALDSARTTGNNQEGDFERGPVECEVIHLIAGRDLDGEKRIAAVQACALARAVDTLTSSKGASAGLALASVSRRLEECISTLRIQPKDALTELRERRAARLASLGNGMVAQ